MTTYSRKWLERHCEENETLIYYFEITCAYCDEVFKKSKKNYIRKFIKHLHDYHGLTELDGHSRCKELKEKFEIVKNYVGMCKKPKCLLRITFVRGVHLLENHLEIYHGKRSSIYKNVIRQNMRAQHILLNNFFITSNNTAKCLICKFEESLSNLELQTEETLETLKEHWAGHFKKTQLDEIYRLEQLQQRRDENLLSDDAGEMGNYFEFTSEEIKNFDKLIEEAVDHEQHIEILIKFKIFNINSERICTHCLRTVMSGDHYYIERNHWELYHGLFAQIYKEILDIEMVHDIFNHYIIMNYMLRCLICTHVFEVKALRLNVEEQLVILLKHRNTHTGISLDHQIEQEEHLRKEFRRKLNTEKELVKVENSRGDDHGQQSSDRDKNTTEQLDELHPEVQQYFYEQYIKQIMEQKANNIDIQKDTAYKKKEKNLRKVDELLKKYDIRPIQTGQLKCLKCDIIVNDKIYNERCLYLVRNHFEIYHGKLNYIYKGIDKEVEKNYRITNSIMWCTVCSANLDMGMNVETIPKKMFILGFHWIYFHSL